MSDETRATVVEWLAFFGEPAERADDCDICDNGSVWLGTEMIAPKGTVQV